MQEYAAFWKNYVNFSDCTSRRGYWMAYLFNAVIGGVLYLLGLAAPFISIFYTIFALASLIPGLAICIRRLRDAGKHWAWIFIAFVPLAGGIVLLVFLCQPTSYGAGVQV